MCSLSIYVCAKLDVLSNRITKAMHTMICSENTYFWLHNTLKKGPIEECMCKALREPPKVLGAHCTYIHNTYYIHTCEARRERMSVCSWAAAMCRGV